MHLGKLEQQEQPCKCIRPVSIAETVPYHLMLSALTSLRFQSHKCVSYFSRHHLSWFEARQRPTRSRGSHQIDGLRNVQGGNQGRRHHFHLLRWAANSSSSLSLTLWNLFGLFSSPLSIKHSCGEDSWVESWAKISSTLWGNFLSLFPPRSSTSKTEKRPRESPTKKGIFSGGIMRLLFRARERKSGRSLTLAM